MDATPMRPPAPYATLQDHTLAVTDLKIGFGRFPACRVYSVSQDCSLKVRNGFAPARLSSHRADVQ